MKVTFLIKGIDIIEVSRSMGQSASSKTSLSIADTRMPFLPNMESNTLPTFFHLSSLSLSSTTP
jgi:hypothetical protein